MNIRCIVLILPLVSGSWILGEQTTTGRIGETDHPSVVGDSIQFIISLVSVSDTLIFDQAHVSDDGREYEWAIYIDTDNNDSTGDSQGFDVSIALSEFKFPGREPSRNTIVGGSQSNTWILKNSGSDYGHQVPVYLDHATNSIIMTGSTSWPELSNVNASNRWMVKTFFYAATGAVSDVTNIAPAASQIHDPRGDVPFGCIDILDARIIISSNR